MKSKEFNSNPDTLARMPPLRQLSGPEQTHPTSLSSILSKHDLPLFDAKRGEMIKVLCKASAKKPAANMCRKSYDCDRLHNNKGHRGKCNRNWSQPILHAVNEADAAQTLVGLGQEAHRILAKPGEPIGSPGKRITPTPNLLGYGSSDDS